MPFLDGPGSEQLLRAAVMTIDMFVFPQAHTDAMTNGRAQVQNRYEL